jgi:DNA polymerase-3 subunit gamma/tau
MRHRLLLHPDLLCLGSRAFSAEIAVSAAALQREPSQASARTLFQRSIRKLLARFNPVVWEDEPKFSKLGPLVVSLEEGLDELNAAFGPPAPDNAAPQGLARAVENLIKDSFRLEAEGVEKTIPIARIRRAAWWSRLAPAGKGKLLLIENADRMQEGARNALLKLLEEPPGPVTMVLASNRSGAMLPTILSRLRPYRFSARDEAAEREVIRRVFRGNDPAEYSTAPAAGRGGLISAYIDSFLPVTGDKIQALAAFFTASAAAKALQLAKKKGPAEPSPLVLGLGKFSAPQAEAAGLGRPVMLCREVCAAVVKGAGDFEIPSVFSRFLKALLDQVSASLRGSADLVRYEQAAFSDLWRACSSRAESSVSVYNQSPSLALERLFTEASSGMAELCVPVR